MSIFKPKATVPVYNHHLWNSVEDLPSEIQEPVIWRLGHWGALDESDWQRLRDLCGEGRHSVQEIFEAERMRWAVKHVMKQCPTLCARAAFKAVALLINKSPERVRQVYYGCKVSTGQDGGEGLAKAG